MGAAGEENDLLAGAGQLRAKEAAGTAGAVDENAHGTLRQRLFGRTPARARPLVLALPITQIVALKRPMRGPTFQSWMRRCRPASSWTRRACACVAGSRRTAHPSSP